MELVWKCSAQCPGLAVHSRRMGQCKNYPNTTRFLHEMRRAAHGQGRMTTALGTVLVTPITRCASLFRYSPPDPKIRHVDPGDLPRTGGAPMSLTYRNNRRRSGFSREELQLDLRLNHRRLHRKDAREKTGDLHVVHALGREVDPREGLDDLVEQVLLGHARDLLVEGEALHDVAHVL
jgi:hypothetical protein